MGGASWGSSGFVFIKRGVNMCGIGSQPSYPTVDGSAPPTPVPSPSPSPSPTPTPTPTPTPIPHVCSHNTDESSCNKDFKAVDGLCKWCDRFMQCYSKAALPA